jgi:arabinose-5-phosphate isomerase
MSTPFLDTARRVIRAEAEALVTLADGLDDRFRDAIDLMRACEGRVIITGIGKSGHIAKKIAATFASTGTPAQFVHPAEASHGDLGMITAADVILAISNSGEAPELGNLIAYSRRHAIPLIGMTSREDSALGKHISTTMTLAMGDALGVALMENRAFTAEHFRAFHPGGKLGAQLSKVSDLMHSGAAMPLVDQNAPMADALNEIAGKSFGVTGVTGAGGELVGIITNGDLSRHMDGLLSLKARDVMTANPVTITPDSLAEKAVAVMNARKITCLLVVDPARADVPAGLLHIHDCLRVGLG